MNIQLFEVQFDKEGNVFQPTQEADIVARLTAGGADAPTDVVAISHGWNNDMDEARTLYREFLSKLGPLVPAGRRAAAIGVLWPSKKFADKDLIASGAASGNATKAAQDATLATLQAMKSVFGTFEDDRSLDALAALLPSLENSKDAQRAFVRGLGELAARHLDAGQASPDEGSARLADKDGAALLASFRMSVLSMGAVAGGGGAAGLAASAGGAAGILDVMNSVTAGAQRLLNLTTYYAMKDRAGVVGKRGVNPMLSRIQAAAPASIRFHLVGHSFGGRLMTAVVDGPNPLRVQTLLLLQAAFSHNGFAARFDGTHDGFFRGVLAARKVTGPILVTHSRNDKAVGVAYPLASRLNGETAAALGDANDKYGGIGRNGAQHVASECEFLQLQPVGGKYNFASGKAIYNLNGDHIIANHGDVARPETAAALAAAMAL